MGRKRVKPENLIIKESGKKRGRPPKFEIDDIERFADELYEWIEHDENYILLKFCNERYILAEELSVFNDASPRFAQALAHAKQVLAMRREDMLNSGTMNQGVFNRYQGMYDKTLHRYERKEKEDDIELKRKLIENTGASVSVTCLDYSK